MNLSLKACTRNVLLLLGLCSASWSQASTTYTYTYSYNWNVNGCGSTWYSSCGLTGSQTGSVASPTPAPADPNAPSASINASASGWANTQGNNSTISDQTLEKGALQSWSGGLGVRNLDYSTSANGGESRLDANEGSSPEHATDNDERWDSILYRFDKSVSLTNVSLSWYSNDSDLTVLAYTGADASNVGFDIESKLTNLKYDQLTANGWSFIKNTTGGYSQDISSAQSSSYWLIGAFNSTFGSGDSNKDYVKIAGLSGTITTQYTPPPPPGGGSVPEPGSLLLLGLGSLMLVRARGRVV